jgi:streptogramin lyase
MTDYRSVLERDLRRVGSPEFDLGDVARRRNRKQRHRRIGTAALALAVAAVSIAGVVRAFHLASAPQPADETQPIVTIPIDLGANYVAVGDGSVWISGPDGVSRVDPATNEVVASLPGHLSPYTGTSIAIGEGAVWAFEGINEREGAASIVRIDPETNEVAATIQTDLVPHFDGGAGPGLWGITTGFGSVWAGSHFGGAVLRVDPATNGVEVIQVPRREVHVGAVLNGRIWIAATDAEAGVCGGDDPLIAIDPASNEIVVHDEPLLVCDEVRAGFGSLWTNPGGSIVRIDPSNPERRVATIDLPWASLRPGAGAMEMAVGDDALWVGLSDPESPDYEGIVVRIDPKTNEVVGELRLPTPANGIAAGEGAVWVTDGLGTLYRIDSDVVRGSS